MITGTTGSRLALRLAGMTVAGYAHGIRRARFPLPKNLPKILR
jgi:hypothetical protein